MKSTWFGRVAAFAAAIVSGALLVAAPVVAYAQDAAEQVAANEAVWTRWFVEMKSPPTADGTSLAAVKGEKAAFRKAAAQAGINYKERFAFDTLWNGLSIEIAPRQVGKLLRLEGVKSVYPVEVPESA